MQYELNAAKSELLRCLDALVRKSDKEALASIIAKLERFQERDLKWTTK